MATETQRTHYRVTYVVLVAGVLAFALLQSLVAPVLPVIRNELHTSQSTATWVMTAYLLSASIFTPIMGRLGDMIGKKKVFVLTMIGLTIGSLVAALAPNIETMILGRTIQGIGGGVLPLAFGIVRDEFPKKRLHGAVSALAALMAAGGGAGVVLAGPINNSLGYTWLFWLPMIVTAASAAAAFILVPESLNRTRGRLSVLPAVALSVWLVALLVAFSKAPAWGWGSGRVVGLLVAAVAIAFAWVLMEKRAKTPIVDMNMMRQKAVWTNNLVALLLGVGMFAVFSFLPQFVTTPKSAGYGFSGSVTEAGLILLPLTVTMFLTGLISGRLVSRIGGKSTVFLGLLVSLAAMLLLTFAHTEKWELYLATGIMGVGFGLAYSSMASLIISAVPPAQTGVASGMNTNLRTVGGSIGAALMASIVTSNLRPDGLPKESGYTHGFAMLSTALVIGALAALLIPRQQKTTIPGQRKSVLQKTATAPAPSGNTAG
ncbi:MFS transporter [Actinacidiphila glaucinigra]|uniref:MFS transporter n=1 Tax=Actinacidiphila glaucinigra TaxID=235986 RepID=UPI00324817AA